jgi:hypothetical protein
MYIVKVAFRLYIKCEAQHTRSLFEEDDMSAQV